MQRLLPAQAELLQRHPESVQDSGGEQGVQARQHERREPGGEPGEVRQDDNDKMMNDEMVYLVRLPKWTSMLYRPASTTGGGTSSS